MNAFIRYYLILVLPLGYVGCTSLKQAVDESSSSPVSTRYYTSAFPSRDISAQLSNIQRSVKRISATAIYQTYYMDEQLITMDYLKGNDLEDLAINTVTQNESTAGTSFAVARNNRSIVLLTCAHVVDFPDTLISYYQGENIPEETFIRSVTVKRTQTNLLYDFPNVGNFEILAQNDRDDLALIEVDLKEFKDLQVPPLPIKMGDPERLRLGSYVMVMGYPKGYPMVTRGIVSDPNRRSDGEFLTDALFNRGISGGIILASRNNYASFEWVGMASTAAATKDMTLVPDPSKIDDYEPFDIYRDSILIQPKFNISYGITQAIPTQKIVRFLQDNRQRLGRLGLDTDFL